MSDLQIKLEKDNPMSSWKKARKITMSVPDIVYYFNFKFFHETDTMYPIKRMNWHEVGNLIKRSIIDEWTERGFGPEELIEFIDWVFTNKKPEQWSIKALKHQVADWIKQRAIKQRRLRGNLEENVRAKRLEEEQYAKYLGEGYFDDQLTKMQYWLGVAWRTKYLKPAEIIKIQKWQANNFPPKVCEKLQLWFQEYLKKKKEFSPRKQFYIELCRTKNQKLTELLYEFSRQKYYGLYTTEELKKDWI